jgi:hypothetical protein
VQNQRSKEKPIKWGVGRRGEGDLNRYNNHEPLLTRLQVDNVEELVVNCATSGKRQKASRPDYMQKKELCGDWVEAKDGKNSLKTEYMGWFTGPGRVPDLNSRLAIKCGKLSGWTDELRWHYGCGCVFRAGCCANATRATS